MAQTHFLISHLVYKNSKHNFLILQSDIMFNSMTQFNHLQQSVGKTSSNFWQLTKIKPQVKR